jgi:hypothetical protein
LTAERICIISNDYRYQAVVDEVVDRIGDRLLKVEVMRYRGLKVKSAGLQEQIRCIEDQLLQCRWIRGLIGIDYRMAQVWERVTEEVRRDQRIHPLMPWSVERGHLP